MRIDAYVAAQLGQLGSLASTGQAAQNNASEIARPVSAMTDPRPDTAEISQEALKLLHQEPG